MSGFNFRPETEITFKGYISFFFSRSHKGVRKKRLRKVLWKHKERDLVYLINKFLSTVKLLFFYKILEEPKLGDPRKKFKKCIRKRGR
jgi:hypothetical protein